MADIVDLANDYAEECLQRALEQRRVAATNAVSAEFCVDCDEPIPLLRQQKVEGCQTCIDCQHIREQRKYGC